MHFASDYDLEIDLLLSNDEVLSSLMAEDPPGENLTTSPSHPPLVKSTPRRSPRLTDKPNKQQQMVDDYVASNWPPSLVNTVYYCGTNRERSVTCKEGSLYIKCTKGCPNPKYPA